MTHPNPLTAFGFALLCSAFVAGPALADNLSYARPESVGMSSTALEHINPLLQGYVDSGELVGAVSMVARRGQVVHFGKFDALID